MKFVFVVKETEQFFRNTGGLGRGLREAGFVVPSGALGEIKANGTSFIAKGKAGAPCASVTVERKEVL